MEFKVIILSVACFSLLTPPVLGSVIVAQAASTALQGATLVGAGLAMKGAAAIMAVKGIAALALKAAAIKGVLLAKGVAAAAGVGAAVLAQKPTSVPTISIQCNTCGGTIIQKPQYPSLLDIISGAVAKKAEIVGEVIDTVRRRRVLVNQPILYEYITAPRCYPMAPVIRKRSILRKSKLPYKFRRG